MTMEDTKEIIKYYSNGEITIVWKPALCIHTKHCWQELPEVFDPNKRPWMNPHGASTEQIIQQINQCPSSALSYFKNDEQEKSEEKAQSQTMETSVEAMFGGPLLVAGNLKVEYNDTIEYKTDVTAFCRCGKTNKPPYCDGSHLDANFNK